MFYVINDTANRKLENNDDLGPPNNITMSVYYAIMLVNVPMNRKQWMVSPL